MCLILSLQQKTKDSRVKSTFAQVVLNNANYHDDGVAILAYNRDNSEIYHNRVMKTTLAEIESVVDKFDVVNVHLRQGTSGVLGVDNTHFWEREGWYFCHNGMMSKYEKTSKDTDSLQFFNHLFSAKVFKGVYINIKKLDKASENKGLAGRCVFVNPASSKMFFYGSFKTYNLDNQAVLIASTDIQLKWNIKVCGFDFASDNIIPHTESEIDGLVVNNYKKQETYQLPCEFKGWSYSNYGGYSAYGDDDEFINPDYPKGTIEHEIAKDVEMREQKQERERKTKDELDEFDEFNEMERKRQGFAF